MLVELPFACSSGSSFCFSCCWLCALLLPGSVTLPFCTCSRRERILRDQPSLPKLALLQVLLVDGALQCTCGRAEGMCGLWGAGAGLQGPHQAEGAHGVA